MFFFRVHFKRFGGVMCRPLSICSNSMVLEGAQVIVKGKGGVFLGGVVLLELIEGLECWHGV